MTTLRQARRLFPPWSSRQVSRSALLSCVGLSLALGMPLKAVASARTADRVSAILTTDCGAEIDDQWALAHMLLSPELDLRAVITTHAPTLQAPAAETSARSVAEVIEHTLPTGARNRPRLVPGSSLPLQNVAIPRENAGVDLLISSSRSFSPSRRLLVFVIGAATDVASALLKDPSLADRITVVAMGFEAWPRGGDSWNVKNDPLAYQVILGSDVPLVVGDAAVTKRHLTLSTSQAGKLMRGRGPVGSYLVSLFDGWVQREAKLAAEVAGPGAWVLWDTVVVAYALGLTRGKQVPRPQLRPDLTFAHPPTSRRITWVTWIDTRRVWRDLTLKIDRHARRAAERQPNPSK